MLLYLHTYTHTYTHLYIYIYILFVFFFVFIMLGTVRVGATCSKSAVLGDIDIECQSHNIKVYVRTRPLSKDEANRGDNSCIQVNYDEKSLKVMCVVLVLLVSVSSFFRSQFYVIICLFICLICSHIAWLIVHTSFAKIVLNPIQSVAWVCICKIIKRLASLRRLY